MLIEDVSAATLSGQADWKMVSSELQEVDSMGFGLSAISHELLARGKVGVRHSGQICEQLSVTRVSIVRRRDE